VASSVIQRIMEHLEARFKAVTIGATKVVLAAEAGAPYTIEYGVDLVTRKPINGLPKGERAILGLYAGKSEPTNTTAEMVNVVQDATLEIHINNEVDEPLEDLLLQALAEAHRVLMEDKTCGGLGFGIVIRGSETDIDGYFSGAGSASLYFTINYRHHRDDPTRGFGDE